ncbi:hypothetical protein BKA69DRAFT_539358 [Paraphysoderma sedebokerense]|nr:hypothetical protein BKA69DRAFT_539358 [Paraphysoderma sedebokerense]
MMSNNRNMHSSPPKLHAVSEFHPVDDYELDFPVLSSQPSEPTHLTKKVEDLQSQFKEVKRYFKALLRIELEQYEHAAILIQSHYRGYLVRKHIQQNELLSRYRQSLKLPAAVHFTLDELLKLCGNVGSKETQPQTGPSTFAVVKIQSVYRGHLIRKYVRNYKLSRESAIKIQSLWRGYRIRKHSKVTVAILKSLCYKSLELVRRLTAQVDSVEEKLYQVSQKRREDEEKMGHLIEETKSLKSIKEKYEDLVQSGNSNQQQKAMYAIQLRCHYYLSC